MGKLNVDLALVNKYNVAGPRYTSYPPAPHFSPEVTWPMLAPHVEENNRAPRDLSLYFHIPFCRSLCWFCGCNAIVTKSQDASATYMDYIEKEMDLLQPRLHPERPVVQLHLGGGTPTFLEPGQFAALGRSLRRRFRFASPLEAGVEIDPRGIGRDHLRALREAGFNRASVGVQDHHPAVQKAVHRIQPREVTAQVIDWIRAEGFTSLNIDLIYGLPLQTVESFERTLEDVLAFEPDRFAVFSFAHVPWIKPAHRVLAKVMPTPETKLRLLKLTVETLTDRGYVYIGMDHFARQNDELAIAQRQGALQRNFQGYSTHGGADIYAFGVSSISQTDRVYWQNHKELPRYYAALDQGIAPVARGCLLTEDDRIRRRIIMQLMCNLHLDYAALSLELGRDVADYFRAELDSLDDLEADGLVWRQEGRLDITDLGRLLVRIVAMRFDACLPRDRERRFSRAI
ncbi:MAG TPA: oxygen-independent coproporphyrinogen III oxidase [Candidatus Paceibacterota bacterium]|nr:oxygen-independent coproporphyrinogen III oxidase [Verrucomicrobiota bacterium]HRZ44290.1 oxygen-independent coproporphyrinogen III oxidase [Candidatus Paceibacterota bacterium]HRZ92390.1 oxygen-independent coproporphyrinogen III oxidase [Candidatus Paceibacterota bacterium]